MMLGELTSWNRTAQIPPWDPLDDPTVGIPLPFSVDNRSPTFNRKTNCQTNSLLTAALCRYLPSNEFVSATESGSLNDESSDNVVVDAFSCDHFRMFEFKIRKCARARSHDWTECPYAHPGEKARRRDPRKCSYSGSSCLEFRKGECRKGESCEFAHGVFESWLHPTRYRTQPCKDGMGCRRRVCFFAHCPEQLRVPTQLSPKSNGPGEFFDESPRRHSFDPYYSISPSESPPTSPNSPQVVSSLVSSMRNLQLGKMKTMSSQWEGFGSPRGSVLRPGLYSNPSTPTQSGFHSFNIWDQKYEEEPSMERVESGRNLRAQKYARLRKQNPLDREESASSAPDFGWVSELIDDL